MTCNFHKFEYLKVVSIHTPTWGVTSESWSYGNTNCVSIHTPTWGVTWNKDKFMGILPFQSTHLHEVWLLEVLLVILIFLFQSTHLHEVWLCVLWYQFSIYCFNPHTYMRCDFKPASSKRLRWVSIHTPTWGVTNILSNTEGFTLFQSTHLHEVWLPIL